MEDKLKNEIAILQIKYNDLLKNTTILDMFDEKYINKSMSLLKKIEAKQRQLEKLNKKEIIEEIFKKGYIIGLTFKIKNEEYKTFLKIIKLKDNPDWYNVFVEKYNLRFETDKTSIPEIKQEIIFELKNYIKACIKKGIKYE